MIIEVYNEGLKNVLGYVTMKPSGPPPSRFEFLHKSTGKTFSMRVVMRGFNEGWNTEHVFVTDLSDYILEQLQGFSKTL